MTNYIRLEQEKMALQDKSREEGEARGENRFSQLINFLLHAGRTNDIERAANDNVFRKSLFAEFGIA